MTLRLHLTIVTCAGLVAAAGAQYDRDRELIEEARRGAAAQAPAGPEALEQAGDEAAAEVDVIVAQARLELLRARRALRDGDLQTAAERAQAALDLLAALPADLDVGDAELTAEGILARAARGGVRVESGERTRPIAAGAGRRVTVTDWMQEQNRRSVERQNVTRALAGESELRALHEADAARIVPPGDVIYPPDWPERVARRAGHRGGQVARSEPWTDEQGREWSAVVYDIRDLTYVVPDFAGPIGVDPAADHYNALDRAALRMRSEIFSGYADDLLAGLPLLNAMGGGVDPFFLRGPKYSYDRQRHLIEMIKGWSQQPTEVQIISIPSVP